jgi:hypothetical protein
MNRALKHVETIPELEAQTLLSNDLEAEAESHQADVEAQ